MKNLIVIYLCFVSVSVFGQTPKDIEADLLKSLKKIEPFVPSGISAPAFDFEWLATEDSLLSAKLEYYAVKYPFTISYKFKALDTTMLGITTSKDSLFRIYSWNTGLGGTQQDYENVFQYRIGNKTYLGTEKSDEDNAKMPVYGDIFTLKNNGKTYYLATYEAQMHVGDFEGGIQVFSIEKDTLNPNVKLIKTKSGLHSRLRFEFSGTDAQESLSFDEKSKTLKLPVYLENGKPNGKYIFYKFTGEYFERVKN